MAEFEAIQSRINTYCGLDCTSCQIGAQCGCGGCMATEGKPFHGACALAKCALEKKVAFCGACPDFPCQLLESFSNDPEHGDRPKGARIENCAKTKAAMVSAARKGTDPQGICGHHCDHCPYTKWCGGCRSQYPSCSFATLFEDRRCPNLTCANEKGIEGCYLCASLAECAKGYYAAADGYVAKGAAMFITKHGKEAYVRALEKEGDRPGDIDSPEKLSAYLENIQS